MKFTFGSDPEFALTYKGQFASAIGVLPDKKKAIKTDRNSFYFDNVLAEVAVRPEDNKVAAVEAVRSALDTLTRIVAPARVTIQASMNFPVAELKHARAIEAGCVAEYSAYTLDRIVPPEEFVVQNPDTDYMQHITAFRTVGGHIHLGADQGALQDGMLQPYVVKMMDLFVGIPEIFFNKDKTAKERRQVYGVAGSHRRPEYGIEYRPLSNFWFSSPRYVELVYDLCAFTLDFVNRKGHMKFWTIYEDLLDEDDPSIAHHCYGYDAKGLRDAMNNYDKKAAEKYMTLIATQLPNSLFKQIEDAISYEPGSLEDEWLLR